MTDRETTAAIHGLLRLRHPKGRGEWATFEEFTPGTGFSATSGRRWDFLAIACWGEGKGRRIGYEVKASRRDWLKELSDPGKRVHIESMCHETWIVAAVGVVESLAEVPKGWGWMELHGSVLHTKRAATQRANVATPDAFVAALARRGMEDGETEPPPVPRGAWKFAGRNIAEVDLVKVCREILDTDHEARVKRDVETKIYALTERLQRLEKMEAILKEELCEVPNEWVLRKRLKQTGTMDVGAVASKLEALAREIREGRMS